VIGDELAIEQLEAADPQACHQMRQPDLRGVAHPAEHALAEIGAAERHAVEAADQRAADVARAPDLDRMGVAVAVQDVVGLLDLAVDPGLGAIARRLRAVAHHLGEGTIGGHREAIRAQRLPQRVGEVEAVERQHAALLGLDPEDVGGVAAVRHREHAHRISAQQEVRVDRLGRRPAPPS